MCWARWKATLHKLLLDTHALLWWLADDARLGRGVRRLIQDPASETWVSVVSLWEIVVKIRVGKLEADICEIVNAVEREGFPLLPIRPAHLLTLAGMPKHHRDPFDHLLMAQAASENATFVSDDGHTALYPIVSLRCVDAR